MNHELVFELQTNADLTPWPVGQDLLSQVFAEPKLRPQRIATFGEVSARHGLDIAGIEDCRDHWANRATLRVNGSLSEFHQDFHWKRRMVPRSQGSVSFSTTNIYGEMLPARIWFQSQFDKNIDWIGLFGSWCELTSPFAALLHPLSLTDGPEVSSKDVTDYTYEEGVQQKAWSRYLGGELYSEFRAGELNSLVSGLTNLGWASWFGPRFAMEVDELAIAGAGFPIHKIGDAYLVQLTDDISDVANDLCLFSMRRAKLKSLFRDNLFLITDEPVLRNV
ncbi:hypothetical protein OSJ77_17040 [Phyllobacterium sp. 0TCS1.6C]|uniref:hypothetical protein n=1 Tax=unclassified Phyllobacterium TaxID=2638441 RepID=UPI0022642C1B|nr:MULTISPECIES: hypothetical protein [unclassified Phyllobacterium]MCX8281900.1 hypothetical protein [Phyllobacterium sp. 0TCS1.6C]MCX8295435.1 hypothetical protein [Phyllobacterium sp. 0TCS1.6A]